MALTLIPRTTHDVQAFVRGPYLVGLAAACGLLTVYLEGVLVTSFVTATVTAFLLAVFLVRTASLTTPVVVLVGSYSALAILGSLVLPLVRQPTAVSATLNLTPTTTYKTMLVFLLAALSVVAGAASHELSAVTRGASAPPVRARTVTRGLRTPTFLLALTCLPALLLIAGIGPGAILSKREYLGITGSRALVSVGTALSLPAVALTSYVLFSSQRRTIRIFSGVVTLAYFVISFASATRQLPLLPLLLLVGWLLSDRRGKRAAPRIAIALLATLILYPLPLTFRTLPEHGLLPYAEHLSSNPALLISPDLGILLNNLLFSFPLAGHVAYVIPDIPLSTFWVSISPLPGSATSWYDIVSTQQVNVYTPFNAIGQLANFGWLYLIAYFSLVGWYFAHLQFVTRRRLPESWRRVANAATLALAGLFVVTTLQYSLRTATRLLYYLLALEILLRLLSVRPRT